MPATGWHAFTEGISMCAGKHAHSGDAGMSMPPILTGILSWQISDLPAVFRVDLRSTPANIGQSPEQYIPDEHADHHRADDELDDAANQKSDEASHSRLEGFLGFFVYQ